MTTTLPPGSYFIRKNSSSRKSSIIQKDLATEFSLDEHQEFFDIAPANSSTGFVTKKPALLGKDLLL